MEIFIHVHETNDFIRCWRLLTVDYHLLKPVIRKFQLYFVEIWPNVIWSFFESLILVVIMILIRKLPNLYCKLPCFHLWSLTCQSWHWSHKFPFFFRPISQGAGIAIKYADIALKMLIENWWHVTLHSGKIELKINKNQCYMT